MIRNKTDKSDAFAIAEFCLKNNPALWVPKPLEIKELQDINKYIDNLKDDLTRWTNRLEKKHHSKTVKDGIYKKIEELEWEIEDLEKEMQKIIKNNPNLLEKYEILIEICGGGTRIATTILSELLDVKNFKSAEQYTAFIGITPCHYQSGSSVNGKSRISRKGNDKARKILYMGATVVKNHNPYFKKWVETLKEKGKMPKVIIIAVMRKLMHIIFGMLKHNTRFDPNKAFA
jgi:transposase